MPLPCRVPFIALTLLLLPLGALQAEEPASVPAADASLTFDGAVVLAAQVALVDEHLTRVADLLGIAAQSEQVRGGDWPRMRPMLAEIQQRVGEIVVWHARPDGAYFLANEGPVDNNLKDRPYFSRVLAGETVIGDLVVGKATGQMSAIVAVPVRQGETTVGVLGASVFMRSLGERIGRLLGVPDGTVLFALDRDGRTAFNIRERWVFADPRAQGSESLTRAVETMLSREAGRVVYDIGGPRQVLFRRSPLTGWTHALGLPRAE